ncbi:TOMM precursor leader peptide-binding protein [Aquimarina sp. D1M17]|uniref:TOMM precursor leader peptide-binding protein n=1 Tax=Aquimarina acroporae TaxID=2937283 RepID=UPI0020C00684|nr:TOMM precursor leader peptide-binding protein [Aquimarina acroporae]MCK8521167.1 TOMM precursor leader peptide-binding protein [Aquimarina acroporae]
MYRIKEKYAKVKVNDQYTIMTSEKDSVLLQSPLAIQLLEAVSNSKVTQEMIVSDYQRYSANLSEVLITLHQLEAEGYITQSKPLFTPEQAAYWEELGYQTEKLATVFKSKTIAVKTLGEVDDTLFKDLCIATGVEFSENPHVTVVLTTSYLHPDLEMINKEMIDNRMPWLLLKLHGTRSYVGPLMISDKEEVACWQCLQHRLVLHDQENRLYQALAKTDNNITRPLISHPLTQQWGSSTALSELVFWLYHKHNLTLENGLVSLDAKTNERTVHTIVKRPQCKACGDIKIAEQHPSPIRLQKQDTLSKHQGGYRTVTPEETLQRYRHHVSEITGVVPYLKEYHPVKGVPIYNFGSGKNLALQSSSLFWLNLHLRSANGGKGKTEIQAKTGALCEAIERYSLMYQGETYTIKDSYKNLEKAIHPNECMLYSSEQYQNREQINNESTKFYSLIPIPFDIDKKIDWTPVYSLTENEFKYLPSGYCYAQYPAEDEKKLFSYPDSNGCAAGNTLEEAILQGFLELVERDAAAIWWYNRIQYPAIDLETVNNAYVNQMFDHYKAIDRSLCVLDITTELGIPVFVAVSHNIKEDENDQILYAFGAHIDAEIALERAVIELNQLLPVVKSDDKGYLTSDKVFVDWLETAKLKDNAYLEPVKDVKKNMKTDYPKLCEPNLYDSIQFCIETVKKQGLETLVVDLTQPDVGLPVAKVIVPGLRHFWRRTAPGRLYDVPVKMGILKKPLTEEQLNPVGIFI